MSQKLPPRIAALQLGLKKRFGGKVDHLRINPQEEPGKDGGPRRANILLYDSVPGGTGYLHQLLAQDVTTLVDVFKQALEAITLCSYNLKAEKDGCYRCVYQYRQGRTMELVSRDRAREVLMELVSTTDQLERVPTIWPVFEEYRAQLASRRLKEVDDAYRDAAQLIAKDTHHPYSAILVDETQDYGPQALRLLRALIEPGKNDLFFVGDGH